MIELQCVSAGYPGRPVLRDVSIAFRATMVALFGNAVTQVEVEHELLLAQILLVGQVPQVYAGV